MEAINQAITERAYNAAVTDAINLLKMIEAQIADDFMRVKGFEPINWSHVGTARHNKQMLVDVLRSIVGDDDEHGFAAATDAALEAARNGGEA